MSGRAPEGSRGTVMNRGDCGAFAVPGLSRFRAWSEGRPNRPHAWSTSAQSTVDSRGSATTSRPLLAP